MATTRLNFTTIYLKQSKLKIQGFGINPNLNHVFLVPVSSVTYKLGDWASDHNTEIYDMKTMDDLINYVRASFSIENIIKGGNLDFLFRLEQREFSCMNIPKSLRAHMRGGRIVLTLRPPYICTSTD
jgi:hypothetical protein